VGVKVLAGVVFLISCYFNFWKLPD